MTNANRDARDALIDAFLATRRATEVLAGPLSAEDQQLQSMPDCSPTKWHRAHTSWFFEAFLLGPAGVAPYDSRFGFLFNSYYEGEGPRHPRSQRGMLSRPGAEEVAAYRRAVDARVVEHLRGAGEDEWARLAPVVRLGLAHEEQHQELILTDILHAFGRNAIAPVYLKSETRAPAGQAESMTWRGFAGGLVDIGAPQDAPFAFDNEGPRHRVFLAPFELGTRLVTVGELAAFVADGGYRTPSLWLAEGFDLVRAHGIVAPAYLRLDAGAWVRFGLSGERALGLDEPVTFLSYYEADALARYLGARVPTEFEWEHAASVASAPIGAGNLLDVSGDVPSSSLRAEPASGEADGGLWQLFGDAWEWTSSAYAPYPRFKPLEGTPGEYNGKFMVGQLVLRGGSAFTPRGHVRPSYRNFWPAATRFQLTGVRLAREL